MVFSSTLFLFGFLPLILLLHFAARSLRARNALLLAASLGFYAWGEAAFVLLLLGSIALNFCAARWIERRKSTGHARLAIALAVAANLLLLIGAKYGNFLADNWNAVAAGLGLPVVQPDPIHLPIGISFYTFQALSYVIDVYRGEAPAQRSLFRTGLYISLFPQLIAGPIVRYRQIADQLGRRSADLAGIASGVERFIIGLGKKVLLANTLSVPADAIFAVPPGDLGWQTAWLGAACYSLQIYFDFSGYSDMAIGLGRIFGFHFPENFDYPYVSRSLREFWRRWHISLSTWFRDYLYIPLGGGRRGRLRTHLNLIIVFLLCGLWHGASWTFALWGLYHGAFLILERGRLGNALARLPRPLRHVYALVVIVIGWVFFRSESLPGALAFISALSGLGAPDTGEFSLALYLNAEVALAGVLAALGCTPWIRALGSDRVGQRRALWGGRFDSWRGSRAGAWVWVGILDGILLLCALSLSAGTHNPFIYFRF